MNENKQLKIAASVLRKQGLVFSDMRDILGVTEDELSGYLKVHNIMLGIQKGNTEAGLRGGYQVK